jgi:hypothetical protein
MSHKQQWWRLGRPAEHGVSSLVMSHKQQWWRLGRLAEHRESSLVNLSKHASLNPAVD